MTGLHHLTFSFGLKTSRETARREIEQVTKALALPVRGITYYQTERCQFADVEVDDWALYEQALEGEV
jgi:hypothetical protein